MRTRAELIAQVAAGATPEILIIGGGINGVGVFRDLALQGVPSLLVEAGDFSSGTSAAPSRLIHGGLRYLETGEPGLVKESLTERNLLMKNARHVVHPQPVWVPLRSWTGGAIGALARVLRLRRTPGRKGALLVKIGLMIYDVFGRAHQTMPNHRMLGAAAARREVPALAPDVRAVAEYYDARISHPERLVLELIADAEADCQEAMAIPYLAAGQQNGGEITLEDKLGGEPLTVRPKLVINAAGAWVDQVQAGLGFNKRLMGGTRGTHLVMRNKQLADDLGGRMLYFETHDFRACLALPLDDSHVYVGTTDIRTDDPDDRRYTDEEVSYIFDVLRPVLPNVAWRHEDIVFVMAGIRPLPFQDDEVGAAGAISRDHRIERYAATDDRPFDTLALVGGKWTTYRKFAEQVTDEVLAHLGQSRRAGTDALPIGGARDLPQSASDRADWVAEMAAETSITPDRCAELATRYGSAARGFAEAEAADPRQFNTLPGYTPAEINKICRTERVCRLDDIILRRTLMGFEGRASRAAVEEVASVAASALDWDAADSAAAIRQTVAFLQTEHRVPQA